MCILMCILVKNRGDTKQQRILKPSLPVHLDSNHADAVDPDANSNDKNEVEYITPMLLESVCVSPSVLEENEVDVGLLITQVSRASLSSVVSIDLRIQIAEFAKSSRRAVERSMFELGEQIGRGLMNM